MLSTRYLNRVRLGNITYRSAQRETLEIPRIGVLHTLYVRVKYTVTSGSSAMSGPLFNTLSRIIRRLEVTVNGSDTVVNTTGPMLEAMARLDDAVPPLGTDDSFVLSGSATATEYDITLPLMFFLPHHRIPDDTGLPTKAFRDVTMAITWGSDDCADLVATTNDAAISNVTCQITGEFHVGVSPAAPKPKSYRARGLSLIDDTLSASQTDYAMEIASAGNPILFRRALITTLVNNVGSDAILSGGSVKLEAVPTIAQTIDGGVLKAINKRRYRVSPQTGVYMIDTELFGEGTDMIDVSQLDADLKLVFDATKQSGTNDFKIQREVVRAFSADR